MCGGKIDRDVNEIMNLKYPYLPENILKSIWEIKISLVNSVLLLTII